MKARVALLIVSAMVAGGGLAAANPPGVKFQDKGGVEINHLRRTNSPTLSGTTNYNTTLAELDSYDFFPVNTSAPGGATLDIDLGDDAAISSDDLGSQWVFQIVVGGSAMTVTAGASGFTTITTNNAAAGTSCEDAGDAIVCRAYTTSKAVCTTFCAD